MTFTLVEEILNGIQYQVHEFTEWIKLPKPFKASKDYFVCKVIGESMNKVIPNGSLCLFRKYTGGSRNGMIVLAQHQDIQDAEFGAGYTIKKYHSEKINDGELWSHSKIVLEAKSFDPKYEDIVLNQDHIEEFQIIGIFVSVI